MAKSLEIAQFRVRRGHEREFVEAHPAAIAAIAESFPGLIRVTTARFRDGRYADVALWESLVDAERAAAGCSAVPAFARLEAMIETISVDHAEVLDSDD